MVKLPTTTTNLPPDFVEKRTQFLHDYGAFLALWSEFELMLEVKIAQLTGMAAKDASIVIGGLNFGSKPSILCSLLEQRGDSETPKKVRAVITHARRNALVHGIAGADRDPIAFAFFKREIGDTYQVKHLTFDADTFNEHFERLRILHGEAADALGLNIDMSPVSTNGTDLRL